MLPAQVRPFTLHLGAQQPFWAPAGHIERAGDFSEGEVEIQKSKRDGIKAIPRQVAGSNGPKLVPSGPPGGHPAPQNGGIWY